MAKKAPTHGFCGGGGGEVTFVVRTKQKAPTLSSLSTTRALPLSLSLSLSDNHHISLYIHPTRQKADENQRGEQISHEKALDPFNSPAN